MFTNSLIRRFLLSRFLINRLKRYNHVTFLRVRLEVRGFIAASRVVRFEWGL